MRWNKLKEPPWRTVVPSLLFLACVLLGWALWRPGTDLRDGRHDRGRNGIWLGHGWLGGNEWFDAYGKQQELPRFRSPVRIQALAELCRTHGITDLFPHLCPATATGDLPPVNDAQVERFLASFPDTRVLPWIGGPYGESPVLEDAAWRGNFVASLSSLLARHPKLAGVHLNIEPMPSGNRAFLRLLEEIKAALPAGKVLSVAAYPPPTRWHPVPNVHWEESYFREVARRADHLAVMMYDTAIRVPKLYQRLMADWTEEVLAWSEGKAVLLGVPTYEDAHTDYHHPTVENLENALLGIHAGLQRKPLPSHYQGLAIYCEWETDANEWAMWAARFRKGAVTK
jgi:hypothetical protein